MGSGFLQVHTITGDLALPVPNAHVKVFNSDGAELYETTTDQNGLTKIFSIKTPETNLKGPQTPSMVSVNVSAPGFTTEHIIGVIINNSQNTYLPVSMTVPIYDTDESTSIDTPAIPHLDTTNEKKKNTEPEDLTKKTPNRHFEYSVIPGDSLWKIAIKFETTVESIKQLNNLQNNNILPGQILKIPEPITFPKNHFKYVIRPGDTLWSLSKKFGTTTEAIKIFNNLSSDLLKTGQMIKIPSDSEMPPMYFNYKIQKGDSLWAIAKKFGTTPEKIMECNNLTGTTIFISQVLKIPLEIQKPNKTVVLDPGHGGSDPGAVNGSRMEKDDNLKLALAVEKNLIDQGYNVIMTRNSDIFMPLEERSEISNRNNADIFVSLHRNSSINPNYNGVETFIQNDSAPINAEYAQNIQNEIVRAGVQQDHGITQENFSVLRNSAAPAMLVEIGFISNEKDNQMFDEKFNEYAASITRGILKSLEN